MKNKNMRRRFTTIIVLFSVFLLAVWAVFFIIASLHNTRTLNAVSDMAINSMLTKLNDSFSNMAAVASVMSGSDTVEDFLLETDVQALYQKTKAVSEIIGNTAYSQIDIDGIVTVTAGGSYHRFTGSASREGLEKLAGGAAGGMPFYSTTEMDGGIYFCLATPVYRHGAHSGELIGYIVTLSNVEKIRHTLQDSAALEGIDTAVVLADTVLVSGRPELDGGSVAALEDEYGSVRSARVSGTNLYAVAAVTKDALNYSTRVFFIIAAVALAALFVTIIFLYRVLSVKTVLPLLQTADSMKSGLLRTQIDSHFIVNTVDCIAQLIRQEKYADAGTAADSLTALITNRHESGDMINIYDELDFLSRYMEIRNIRSGGKYDFNIEVDPEMGKYSMPAQVLQPLAENAVHHGFAAMKEGCRLTVTGIIEKNRAVFEVNDNGIGMEAGQIGGMNEMLDTADEWDFDEYRIKGVALLNIQKRIRAAYGKDFGLSVRGGPGKGLSVTVRLPLIEDTDKEDEES